MIFGTTRIGTSKPFRRGARDKSHYGRSRPVENLCRVGNAAFSIADVSSEYRYLVSGNYMVFYRVQGSDVYIDRVLYGRSNYMSILFNDLLREDTDE